TVIEVLLIFSLSLTSVTLLPSRSSSSSPPFSPDNSTDTSRNTLAANAGCYFHSTRILTHARVPTSKRIYQRAAYSSTT
ncbi:hypothetical protein C8Q75DRAFT_786696, partial [Abortiporus biennis]